MRPGLLIAVLSAAFLGFANPVSIVENGRCDWMIVHGSAERDRLAATDLQEIFEKATGVKLRIQGGRRKEKGESEDGKAFFVGAEFAGKELEDEQTLVTEKDGNIVLAGGGVAGTCYAVYDFCEKYFGYRLYGMQPGAEIVKEVRDLTWDGKDISTRPAFRGYRISHNAPKARNEAEARFFRRNRNNAGDRPLCNRVMGAQHGVHLWIPSRAGQTWLDRQIGETWEPMFDTHPEYFTLHSDGKRIPDGQLCFTNRGLRDLFIRRFRAYAAKMGPGIYTVGPYDSYNGRFCWCPECSKLVEKHKTNGAPLWDFILELCAAVRDMKDVYVLSFAYKGPEQSEVAPVGIEFPDNFICDAAFLNDRPPTLMAERKMADGSVYNRVESLKKWRSITKNLAWWYYGGSSPMQTYRRMQMELRELRDFGVDSVGSDGTGGEMEFGDVGDYMYFQLLFNPEMDADAAVLDIFRHKYGAAAKAVFAYLRELEQYGLDGFKKPGFTVGCMDTYESLMVEGKDLVRWQGYFDWAVRKVKDDPAHLRNVEIARAGLDAWTVVYANRVRAADPAHPLDVPPVLARGLEACAAAEKSGLVRKDRNPARRVFESMKYYAALKSEALPPELAAYDSKDVRLYLPEDPQPCFAKTAPLRRDPLAAAGVAMVGELRGGLGREKGVSVQLHDSQTKEWLKVRPIPGSAFRDGRYVLVNCGTARLPRRGMLVLGDRWGTSLDIRNLGRYYDPTYHQRQYEYWVSVRLDGRDLLCDRVYLVDRGMPGGLSAGFARADITPEPGVLMPGYFTVRESKGVRDPLEANCLVFSDGKTSALLAVIDCVDMPDAFADEARKAIAAKTGIAEGAIIVHATHTHTGGDLRRTANRLLGPEAAAAKKRLSDAYARKTVAALADAAARAVADLKPAHLSCGRSAARRISFGRRYRMKDGSVRTNPGVLNPDIVGAAGNPPDEEVQLLRIDREGADPIAVLNFQTHPDVIGGELFSADWPGFARRTFEASLEGRVRCLLMNGTEGDVNHVCVDPTPEEQKGLHPDFDDVPRGYAHAQHMGATIAAAALQVWHKTTTLEAGKIRFGGKTVYVPSNRPRPDEMEEARRIDALHRAGRDAELPYKGMDLTTKVAAAERKIRLEHGPDSFELPLSAFAIGSSVAFGGFPGEPFNDIGKAVKKGSPFKMTILACLTNGDRGYFPFSDSYREGGYESESSPFGPSVADDLIAGQIELLKEIK